MTWRSLSGAALVLGLAAWAGAASARAAVQPSVRYLPLDAPAGMSQAVIVQGLPLVYTRQLLPLGGDGKLVGEGSADRQSEQVLANLEAVLGAAGSGLGKLVRLNICALSHEAAGRLREQLRRRLDPAVRPAITIVLTPLAHRKALVAVDAVAVAANQGPALVHCPSVAGGFAVAAGEQPSADAAVMPRGGVAYLSGQPERGGLTVPAVTKSMSTLLKTLAAAKLAPSQVVQVKVFLTPASSAEEVLAEVKKFFPGQLTPPVVFVEWIASAPVEIELIAHLPLQSKAAESVQYFNPPEVRPTPAFSRVALVCTERQVFISGLSARAAGDGLAQARDVFAQLKQILPETGCDFRHLAKATYYVSDDEASDTLNKVRAEFLDPQRPPAASKVTVHGVGHPQRTLTVDMIAVGSAP